MWKVFWSITLTVYGTMRSKMNSTRVTSVRDHLKEDITSEEIEIIHRIGPKKSSEGRDQGSRR